jgi:hypothetical protein
VICARCRRQITRPVHVAGMTLGAKCAAAVAGAKPRRPRAHKERSDANQPDLFAEVRA